MPLWQTDVQAVLVLDPRIDQSSGGRPASMESSRSLLLKRVSFLAPASDGGTQPASRSPRAVPLLVAAVYDAIDLSRVDVSLVDMSFGAHWPSQCRGRWPLARRRERLPAAVGAPPHGGGRPRAWAMCAAPRARAAGAPSGRRRRPGYS